MVTGGVYSYMVYLTHPPSHTVNLKHTKFKPPKYFQSHQFNVTPIYTYRMIIKSQGSNSRKTVTHTLTQHKLLSILALII